MPITFRDATPIDPNSETLITLAETARSVQPAGISMATLHRWLQHGVRIRGTDQRIRLATLWVGGRRMTSREALSRFFASQNAPETPVPAITAGQRQTQSEAARRELEKMGI